MIRNFILFALVAVICYCAAVSAPRPEVSAYALAVPARADGRARRQFIPGALTTRHAAARELVAALPKTDPSA